MANIGAPTREYEIQPVPDPELAPVREPSPEWTPAETPVEDPELVPA